MAYGDLIQYQFFSNYKMNYNLHYVKLIKIKTKKEVKINPLKKQQQ